MDPRNDGETVGFIDVGTNSIHLLVVRFYKDAAASPIYHDKQSVRLGKCLYGCGTLDQMSLEKSSLVIRRFARTSRELGADRVIAFATCAAREADNGNLLVDAVSDVVELRVISGIEEARLISLGIFGVERSDECVLAMDIGGGSTEVILHQDGEDLFLDSLSMGALRYAYGMGIDCSRPVSQSDYALMLRRVDLSSYHAVNKVRANGFDRAIGSSGTMQCIAEMCAAKRGDGDDSYFTFEELHSLMMRLCSMTAEQRLTVPGLGKNRADIIIPGGAIAEELMSQFGISRMEVTKSGLKQGMMLDHRLSQGYTVFDAREAAAKALGLRCRFDLRHAEIVERNALDLFDQTQALGLHSLGPKWRSLLSCSAILHDVGEVISYQNHNVLSQAIIENSELPGFTCDETEAMGMIVRFHHKKFPGAKDPRLSGFAPDTAMAIRICAILLKMADVMDRHRNDSIVSFRIYPSDGVMRLDIVAEEDPSMEIWSLEKISADFRKLFGMELIPRPL